MKVLYPTYTPIYKTVRKKIAKVHILKADIFTLEKPDISILELH